MDKLTYWKALLKNIVDGLVTQGWSETGGSDVFRLLHNDRDDCLKVFLNDYTDPSNIVVRFSASRTLEEVDKQEIERGCKVCPHCLKLMVQNDSLCAHCGEFSL